MSAPGETERRTARLRIWRGTGPGDGRHEEHDITFEPGDSVLDALVRLRREKLPDLAFRFSCFNANVCKECTMLIDGHVAYACIVKLSEGTHQIDPLPGQPLLRDLVTDTISRKERP